MNITDERTRAYIYRAALAIYVGYPLSTIASWTVDAPIAPAAEQS